MYTQPALAKSLYLICLAGDVSRQRNPITVAAVSPWRETVDMLRGLFSILVIDKQQVFN